MLCYVALCSQYFYAQTQLGIEDLFHLADENSQSIRTYKTSKEVADEALKAAKAQRLPDINVPFLPVIGEMENCGTGISVMPQR